MKAQFNDSGCVEYGQTMSINWNDSPEKHKLIIEKCIDAANQCLNDGDVFEIRSRTNVGPSVLIWYCCKSPDPSVPTPLMQLKPLFILNSKDYIRDELGGFLLLARIKVEKNDH